MSTCEHCGNPFESINNAGQPQRFCGERCRKKAEKKRGKGRNRKSRDLTRLKETGLQWHEQRCDNCSAVFPKYNDPDNRQGWRKYCSTECNEAIKKKRIEARKAPLRTLGCEECGEEFSTYHLRKNCSNKVCKRFCSKKEIRQEI